MSVVFKPERLESPISVEGIHGSPANSKVRLDGYGFICILDVSVVYDGVLIEHGFQLRKSKGKVEIKPPSADSTWLSLYLDPDGRAYLYEYLFSKPPQVSILSLRDISTSLDIWHARLGHRSYGYLEAMQRFPQYVEAGFNVSDTKTSTLWIATRNYMLVRKLTTYYVYGDVNVSSMINKEINPI